MTKYFNDIMIETGRRCKMKKRIKEHSERLQKLSNEMIKLYQDITEYDKQGELSCPLSAALDKLDTTLNRFDKAKKYGLPKNITVGINLKYEGGWNGRVCITGEENGKRFNRENVADIEEENGKVVVNYYLFWCWKDISEESKNDIKEQINRAVSALAKDITIKQGEENEV
jgi:hypothetical protein